MFLVDCEMGRSRKRRDGKERQGASEEM